MCPNDSAGLITGVIGIVGAIAGSTIGAFVSYRLLSLRELKTAVGKFHASFAEVKNALEDGTFRPELLAASVGSHDQAIAMFGCYVNASEWPSFNDAAQTYRRSRTTVIRGGAFGQITDVAKKDLVEAIEKLLACAK